MNSRVIWEIPGVVSESLRRAGAGCRSLLPRLRIRRCHSECGQALVEFAYVAPVLLLVTFGLMMFGSALNKYLVLTNAVEIGGQLLATERGEATDPCAAATTATENAATGMTLTNTSFSYNINGTSYPSTNSCTGITLKSGWNATVTVTYPLSFTVPFLGSESYTLTASIEEVIQ